MDYSMCMRLDTLPAMVAGILSNERQLQLAMTTQFRKLLSISGNPHVEEVIQSGVVPRLVEFLTRVDFPELQFEAAWGLTNIASGTSENTRVVVDHGAVPIFVMLLGSPSDDVREQAVWALGNVAGDSPEFRDLVLSHGALIPLLALLNENAKPTMLVNAAWTLSNLCKGKPQPVFEQLKPALPTLEHLLRSNDEEVLRHACWALSYLSDGARDRIQALIDAGVCKRLVELLDHPSTKVRNPALDTIGNIVTGEDVQSQCMIDHGVLPRLLSLLRTHHNGTWIKKRCCWTISNITAGNSDQIQAVIEAGLISPLVNLLRTADFDIKREVAWAITNFTCSGTNKQIIYLVNQNCIKPLCDILVWPDARIVEACLEGLKNILRVGDQARGNGVNHFAKLIDEAGGFDKIKTLRAHDKNIVIRAKAARILRAAHWRKDNVALPATDEAQLRSNFGSMVI